MPFQGLGKYFYDYRIRNGAIEILLIGKIPVAKFLLKDVSAIKEIPLKTTLQPDFTTLRLGNKFFGRILEITRTRGFFKRVLFTPDNADAFLSEALKAKAKVSSKPTE
jgi:hypothetical protein